MASLARAPARRARAVGNESTAWRSCPSAARWLPA